MRAVLQRVCQAEMRVSLVNDGPMTMLLDSESGARKQGAVPVS